MLKWQHFVAAPLIELLRPINHPALAQFLEDHGPGLHHGAFAVKHLPKRIEELREKGVFVSEPFVAGTGWRIAYFDLDKSGLPLVPGSIPWRPHRRGGPIEKSSA